MEEKRGGVQERGSKQAHTGGRETYAGGNPSPRRRAHSRAPRRRPALGHPRRRGARRLGPPLLPVVRTGSVRVAAGRSGGGVRAGARPRRARRRFAARARGGNGGGGVCLRGPTGDGGRGGSGDPALAGGGPGGERGGFDNGPRPAPA